MQRAQNTSAIISIVVGYVLLWVFIFIRPRLEIVYFIEDIENIQINDLDEMFIKSLQKKRICFVVLGQNVLAQSILVNELLARYILPFEITNKVSEENWRFVRIKVGLSN